MKAIEVHYLPATNTLPSRLKATAEGGQRSHQLTIPYDHAFGGAAMYAQAAIALALKMGWTNSGALVSGGLVSGGYVFCFADSERFAIEPAAVKS